MDKGFERRQFVKGLAALVTGGVITWAAAYRLLNAYSAPSSGGAGILRELRDVRLSNPPIARDILSYNASTKLWTETALFPVRNVSVNTTATADDFLILVNATNGNITVNLPEAKNTGLSLLIKKIDASANTVTIARTGTDLIDGLTSLILGTRYNAITLYADGGTAWTRFNPHFHANRLNGGSGLSGESTDNVNWTTLSTVSFGRVNANQGGGSILAWIGIQLNVTLAIGTGQLRVVRVTDNLVIMGPKALKAGDDNYLGFDINLALTDANLQYRLEFKVDNPGDDVLINDGVWFVQLNSTGTDNTG